MGNWRTVQIEGKVSPEQATDMIEWLSYEANIDWNEIEWDQEHPIEYLQMHRSLCGINQWVNEDGTIDRSGNLAAKEPREEDILRELKILAEKYDTLELKLHLGGDYESEECVATFTVKNGEVAQGEPEKETVGGVTMGEMQSRMFGFLTRGM